MTDRYIEGIALTVRECAALCYRLGSISEPQSEQSKLYRSGLKKLMQGALLPVDAHALISGSPGSDARREDDQAGDNALEGDSGDSARQIEMPAGENLAFEFDHP